MTSGETISRETIRERLADAAGLSIEQRVQRQLDYSALSISERTACDAADERAFANLKGGL